MPAAILSPVAADELEFRDVLDLYRSVGWTAYIVVARVGHRLIGLARLVSDSASIAYLQDVLVHPRHQRSGIGAALVTAVFTPYQAVRQKVLLADDQPTPRAFYLSIGWQDLCRHPTVGLRAFVRFDG